MNRILEALPYVCVGGLALQQALELLDGVLPIGFWEARKKMVYKLIALGAGAAGAYMGGPVFPRFNWIELVSLGTLVAAAVEIWNSLLKALIYTKEARKADAARSLSTAGALSLEALAKK